MTAYRNDYDETKYIFLIKNDKLLEKCNESRQKVRIVSKKLIVNQYAMKNI